MVISFVESVKHHQLKQIQDNNNTEKKIIITIIILYSAFTIRKKHHLSEMLVAPHKKQTKSNGWLFQLPSLGWLGSCGFHRTSIPRYVVGEIKSTGRSASPIWAADLPRVSVSPAGDTHNRPRCTGFFKKKHQDEITFLVRDPYKPSFPGMGPHQRYIYIYINTFGLNLW